MKCIIVILLKLSAKQNSAGNAWLTGKTILLIISSAII